MGEAREQGEVVGGMSRRASAWLAWSVCTLSLLIMAISLLLIVSGWSTPLPRGWGPRRELVIEIVGNIGPPILGGLIASRRPDNTYGWLWLGFGLSWALLFFAGAYAAYALVVEPGSLPAPRAIVMLVEPVGFVAGLTLLPFLFLLFPDGRLPSRRWRFLAWIVVAVGTMLVVAAALQKTEKGTFAPVEDPVGVGGAVGKAIPFLTFGGIMVLFAAGILSAVSLVFRFRRAAGVERQQIKWFAYAAALFGGYLVLNFFVSGLLNTLFSTAASVALYAAVAIAILRHRLYDIDHIINRTLVYGALTAFLALVYFGGVALLQGIGTVILQVPFRILTGEKSTLAVVASTLVIAALFNPLRRRMQAFVDRRFYRRKYDARKTLEAFSAQLRDETDLEALNNELVGVARETMQPAHASLWLRPDTAPKSEQAE
jgi:hypothetical protein